MTTVRVGSRHATTHSYKRVLGEIKPQGILREELCMDELQPGSSMYLTRLQWQLQYMEGCSSLNVYMF